MSEEPKPSTSKEPDEPVEPPKPKTEMKAQKSASAPMINYKKTGDIVILIRRLNEDWYYGKALDKEGMFPASFIEVQVPLIENESDTTVMALYEFTPQMTSDLALKPGQLVKVIRRINDEWLYGLSNGQYGEFPSNFVDRVPIL